MSFVRLAAGILLFSSTALPACSAPARGVAPELCLLVGAEGAEGAPIARQTGDFLETRGFEGEAGSGGWFGRTRDGSARAAASTHMGSAGTVISYHQVRGKVDRGLVESLRSFAYERFGDDWGVKPCSEQPDFHGPLLYE